MFSSATKLTLPVVLLASLFSPLTPAYTIPGTDITIPNIADAPPPELFTTVHSPQCKDINYGTYLCCSAMFDGGNPAVATVAELAGYKLPKNTVNGILCV